MMNKEDISGDEITTFKAKVIITLLNPRPKSPKVETYWDRKNFQTFH